MKSLSIVFDLVALHRLSWLRQSAIVGGLILSTVLISASAQEFPSGGSGFFDRNPGFAGDRKSLDPYDPFAPTMIGVDAAATKVAKPVEAQDANTLQWDPAKMAPQPGWPGEPF